MVVGREIALLDTTPTATTIVPFERVLVRVLFKCGEILFANSIRD